MKKCPKCGTECTDDLKTCSECGNSLDVTQEPKRKNIFKILKEKKQLIKTIFIILGAIVILTISVLFIWHAFDNRNIRKAKEAIVNGDYNKAISYYSWVMPLSYAHSEAVVEISKIKEAGALYEESKKDIANYRYFNAMQNTKTALALCPDFKVCDELFTEAQTNMGKYVKKQFDSGKYTEAYKNITKIYKPYRNKQMENVLVSIDNVVEQYVNKGYEKLKAKDPVSAINYANEAFNINPNHEDIEKLKNSVISYYIQIATTQFKNYKIDSALATIDLAKAINPTNKSINDLVYTINSYKTYLDSLKSANNYYNQGNYNDAINCIDNVPTNTAGNMARNKYSTLIKTISKDKEYLSKPVKVSSLSSHSELSFVVRNVYNTGYNYVLSDKVYDVEVFYTLTNRLSRPVKATILGEINDGKTGSKEATIDIPANSSFSSSLYMQRLVIAEDTYNYHVKVTDFKIQ